MSSRLNHSILIFSELSIKLTWSHNICLNVCDVAFFVLVEYYTCVKVSYGLGFVKFKKNIAIEIRKILNGKNWFGFRIFVKLIIHWTRGMAGTPSMKISNRLFFKLFFTKSVFVSAFLYFISRHFANKTSQNFEKPSGISILNLYKNVFLFVFFKKFNFVNYHRSTLIRLLTIGRVSGKSCLLFG